MKELRITERDLLVSYDVKGLFTSIPIEYTLKVLQSLLDNDSQLSSRTKLNPYHITKLVSFCMPEGNYFHFEDKFFKHNSGAPMGSPLSPVLAEVFMDSFERKVFATISSNIKPSFFNRYVDDIFAIIESGKEDQFLEELNSAFPYQILFTIEKEENNRLPFLDSLILRSKGTLKTTAYRKPTHSDRYLNFFSYHPKSVMKGVVRSLVDRAVGICDPEFLEEELSHITRTLENNDYPTQLIRSTIRERQNRGYRRSTRTIRPITLCTPYLTGLGEKLIRLGKSFNFKIFFKSAPNMRTILRNDKSTIPLEEKPGVVYAVNCDCGATYIGETGNSINHRFMEHTKCLTRYLNAKSRTEGTQTRHRRRPQTLEPTAIMTQCMMASAVAEHAATCSSRLQPEVLCVENQLRARKVKEALYIRYNTTINRDKGVEIDELWGPLVLSPKCCSLN
uniref:Reverse transcriptase domain-containing protein n=1 Tax=Trichuris muris TaxID=70415 RepID=A0A5S6QS56_TRIMR